MSHANDYSILHATIDDFYEILAFLENDFLHNEPLNASLQLTALETRDFLKELINAGLKDPVSYLAKLPRGEIIGIRLSTIMKRPTSSHLHTNNEEKGLFNESPSKTKTENIHKIANFISELESRLFKSLDYKDLYVLEHSKWVDEKGERIFRCTDGTDRGVLAFKLL